MEDIELSRKDLYEKVWSVPMTKLAKQFGLSDVGLAKICRKNNIPVPPRGYWAQKQALHHPTITPLPHSQSECRIVISISNHEGALPATEKYNPAKEAFAQPVVVPPQLMKPHTLVQQCQKVLSEAKPDKDGVLSSRRTQCLNVSVSHGSMNRALRIMDTIIKTLEDAKYRVFISKHGTAVRIGQIDVFFGLFEKRRQERIKNKPPFNIFNPEYENVLVPSGLLELAILYQWGNGRERVWRDTPRRKIETCINQFLTGLIDYSDRVLADNLRRQEEMKKAEEQAARKAEKRALVEAERKKLSKLIADAEKWKKSTLIRDFAKNVEEAVQRGSSSFVPLEELQEWLAWALNQADRLDPLRPSPASILDEEDGLK